jgi:hypothetical protein
MTEIVAFILDVGLHHGLHLLGKPVINQKKKPYPLKKAPVSHYLTKAFDVSSK